MDISNLSDFRKMDDDTGQFTYYCPEHEPPMEFNTQQGWKLHMQKEHGGITSSESGSSASPSGAEAGTGAGKSGTAPRPKKLSQKSRELNDKMNECCNLCVKHLVDGITEAENERLGVLRGELFMAILGIEFNFDDKLLVVSSKWVLVGVLVALYITPSMPSFKDTIAAAKKKIQQQKEKEKDKEKL